MVRSRVVSMGLGVLLPCALAGASCGDDLPEADTLPFQTRVDDARQLDMLTPDELATLCQDFAAHDSDFVHRPRVIEGACRLRVDSSAPACQQMKQECITELAMKPYAPTCPHWSTPCDSTIADFERCWAATEWYLVQFFYALPDCGSTTGSAADLEMATAVKRAECAAYFDGCPSA
jgi:hypothetical protein